MRATRMLFASINFPVHVKARAVRVAFASSCHFAAAVLFRVALLLLFGPLVHAQTAHFFMSESILPTPTGLYYPNQVAVDTIGNIYIADGSNDRVVKETPAEGGFQETVISTGSGQPYGVAVDQSGNIFIACDNLAYLIKETLTPTGYTQSTLGGELFSPSSLAVDSQGDVYVAAYSELVVETPTGGSYVQSGVTINGANQRLISSVAVDSNSNLYITGLDMNYLGHVWKLTLNNDGYSADSLATNPSGFGGVAVDGTGKIYLANGSYSDILVFTPSGGGFYNSGALPQESYYFGVLNTGYVAVDQNGNVFFTDHFNQLLVEYSTGGGNAGPLAANGGYSSGYPISEFFSIDTAPTTGSEGVVPVGANSTQLDFFDGGNGSCEAGPWSQGDVCSVDVYFQPTAVGDRRGAAVLYDGNGNTIATGYAGGIGRGPLVNFSPGTAINENIASDGSAVAVDANGNLYTVAPGRSTAFEDVPAGGAGNWTETTVGSGLGSATGIAIDGAGDLYIADQANKEIVKETLSSSGYSQSVIANQSNGLSQPTGVAVDESGNVYVTDPGTTTGVFKETPSVSGYVQSVIPTSTLSQPGGITVDSIGSVYVADTNNNRVLKETPSGASYTESTIGTSLSSPTAVAVDGFGNVYISETSAGVVLKETLVAGSYVQSTIASGIQPYGLALDAALNLYIAGSSTQLLVKVDVSDGPTLSFANTSVGQVSSDSPKTITFANAGNAPLTLPIVAGENNPSLGGSYLLDASQGNDCPVVTPSSSAPGTLAAGASCLLSISFSPLSFGSNPGTLTVWDNNLNAPAPNYTSQSIQLQGTAKGPAALTSPTPGSTLAGSSVNFTWNPGMATEFDLYIGTAGVGSQNIYTTGIVTTTSANVTGLPVFGQKLYVRLLSKVNGTWQYLDYTYTASGTPTPASLTTPTPGSTLAGSSVNFSWNAGSATEFDLYVGTAGAGSQNIYTTGIVTTTSAGVTGLPVFGQKLYVRLASKVNGVWQYNDYTYTASGTPTPASLTTPTPGSTLAGSSVNFSWNAGSATEFDLYIGTAGAGSQNIYTTGIVTTTSAGVTGLPVFGQTIYVRLSSKVNGVWQYNDYTYTASGTPTPASLTTPTPGSTLAGSSVNFSWNAGSATEFDLYIGTTGAGSKDIFTTGIVTTTSAGVTGLPVFGQTIYVRLSSKVNGTWQYIDYTYTASGTPTPASLTTPTPGSTLAGSSVNFSWNAGSATEFDLYIGTAGVGSQNIYTTGIVTTTSASVTGLPVSGQKLYVRLASKVNGTWQYIDYTYTAE